MTRAQKEAWVDRCGDMVAALVTAAQLRGYVVDGAHLNACALLWWGPKGGRSAAMHAGRRLVKEGRAMLARSLA